MEATSEPLDLPTPPEVIAFDSIGTLFSLTSIEPLFTAAGGTAATVDQWISRVLADGFALTAAREFRPFRDVAKAALQDLLPKAKPTARDKILAGLNKLEAFPDAAPAMGRTVMNARAIVITNASRDTTKKLLAKGGLDAFVDAFVSADEVKEWKPGSDPYAFAAATQEVSLEQMAVVSAHPWDILGARKAGLVTGWCNRSGAAFPPPFGKPDVTGKNLVEVVEALLALHQG